MTRTMRIVAIALAVSIVQIGYLASMIVGRAAILREGREVSFPVKPVDPRDLLRGDYVRLSYPISSIPHELVENAADGRADRTQISVYVRVRKAEDGVWRPVSASLGAPPNAPLQAGDLDILGKTRARVTENAALRVEYGIERFYLPEGEGGAIEQGMRKRSFTVTLAVAADGTAMVKALYDGEKLLYEEPPY